MSVNIAPSLSRHKNIPYHSLQIRASNEKEWLADTTVESCMACNDRFSKLALIRRHHCRFCGHIFCGRCSPELVMDGGSCRVCFACLRLELNKLARSDEAPAAPAKRSELVEEISGLDKAASAHSLALQGPITLNREPTRVTPSSAPQTERKSSASQLAFTPMSAKLIPGANDQSVLTPDEFEFFSTTIMNLVLPATECARSDLRLVSTSIENTVQDRLVHLEVNTTTTTTTTTLLLLLLLLIIMIIIMIIIIIITIIIY
jgi:hypothetical protein